MSTLFVNLKEAAQFDDSYIRSMHEQEQDYNDFEAKAIDAEIEAAWQDGIRADRGARIATISRRIIEHILNSGAYKIPTSDYRTLITLLDEAKICGDYASDTSDEKFLNRSEKHFKTAVEKLESVLGRKIPWAHLD